MAKASAVLSTKRLMIDKANTRTVVFVSVAVFIVIFSLIATKTLIGQAGYQNRVISAKRTAVNQLKSDINATGQLAASYSAFNSTAQNIIGGNTNGTGPKDGNNSKIVLDALPSAYDFPGLTTSIQSLLTGQGVKIDSIGGTDDEVAQSANGVSSAPQSVAIPFTVTVEGDYASIQNVINAMQNSIRPIQILNLSIEGDQSNLSATISAQTYYQPAKSLNISKEAVK